MNPFSAIRLPLLFALLGLCLFAQAQTSPRLHLMAGEYDLNPAQTWEQVREASPAHLGKRYIILQFNDLPSEEEKEMLEKEGVKLLQYLPDMAFFAEVDEDLQSIDKNKYHLYSISNIHFMYKLCPEIMNGLCPGYARSLKGDLLTVYCLPSVEMDSLPFHKFMIQSKTPYKNVFNIIIPDEYVVEIALLPFVSYIAIREPDKQLELTYRNTVGRANYLSSGVNGLNFNGKGVTLAIEESGFVDTTNIDFVGRKVEYTPLSQGVGGHKTGCFENAGCAGNYDPKFRANAWGARMLSLSGSSWSYYTSDSLRTISHSYGWGVSGGYDATSADHDNQIRTQRSMMHFYSSGNEGSSASTYGPYSGIAGWANLTGAPKQAKNLMAICNATSLDSLSFGSVGPTYDGRIKPDVCIEGVEGTSYASPKAAGMMAQLYQVYKSQHSGTDPNSGLIKAMMLNTADEMFTPGPDFKTGFGRINVRRAYKCLTSNQFFADSLSNGGVKTHTIAVPANVKEIRVLTYWNDYQATPNAATALVNNLNTTLLAPNNTSYQPWILNTAANADSLDNPAKRGLDNLNNVEQITLANPTAGNYTLTVVGATVPQGPQLYFVVYEFLMNELTVTYPTGNEHFVAGEQEIIRWDNYGDAINTLSIEFSSDSGQTWNSVVSSLPATQTCYTWTVPNVVTGKGLIRVSRNGTQSQSLRAFNIAPVVQNIGTLWSCGDSLMLTWDAVPGATAYRVTRLGIKYMDSVGVTTSTHFKVTNVNTTKGEWFSVQAYCANGALGRRTLAWHWTPVNTGCVPVDGYLKKVYPYESGYYPTCFTNTKRPLRVVIQNAGTQTLTNATIKFQIGNGAIYSTSFSGLLASADIALTQTIDSLSFSTAGTYTLKVWLQINGDANTTNDTLKIPIIVYSASKQSPQYTQNFDNFTNCSTSWGCESVSCGLSGGWYNVPNTPTFAGDSIDWRTLSGATGTASTGPDFDHTSGSGKYIYLETSSTNGSGCQYKEADVHSTCIDLTGTQQPALDWWYHAYGSTIGSLRVDILGDSGWTKAVVPAVSGDQGNSWKNNVASLSNWQNQVVMVRFVGTTGGGYTGDLAIDDIKVTTRPKTTFQPSVSAICTGTTLTIQNTTTFANSYNWNISPAAGVSFVAGNASSAQPSLSFSAAGTYTLRLVATNAIGNDTLTKTVQVGAAPAQTSILANASSLCVGDSLSLTASATSLFSLLYIWKRNNNPLGINTNFYTLSAVNQANAGTYTCEITNQCGTAQASQLITVSALPVVSLGNDTTIATNGSATLTPGAGFASYIWNGNVAQNQATYAFSGAQSGAGTFPVSVTVTNAAGCANTDTMLITVVNAAQALFTPIKNTICAGDTLSISNNALYSSAFQWTLSPISPFAIGSDTATSPAWILPQSGIYQLQMIASNAHSSDTLTQTITALPNPVVSLGPDTTMLDTATLLLNAGAGFASYLWNNDPSQTSQNQLVNGALIGLGTHVFSIIVTDENGCFGKDTITIIVEHYSGSNPQLADGLILAPNPNTGQGWLSLKAGTPLPQQLSLVDATGRVLWTQNVATQQPPYLLDFSTLANGVYLLRVVSAKGEAVLKVSVVR